MAQQARPQQARWPRMVVGSVLLWRALCATAFADSPPLADPRFLAEWSSPGLNRSVRLAFPDQSASQSGPASAIDLMR